VLVGAAKNGAFATTSRAVMGIVRPRLGSSWLVPLLARLTYDDLVVLKELVEAGKLCPVIDREYPLSETPEAVRYVGTGQARAKVVINVSAM
jgi:NADPH:quinone reductase-like Zn-dependent oxidoreductase